MSFLKNPHLDLSTQQLDLPIGSLAPVKEGRFSPEDIISEWNQVFSQESHMIVADAQREIRNAVMMMKYRSVFFVHLILSDGSLGGGTDLLLAEHPVNISIWLRKDIQGIGYGKLVYSRMIDWVRENTRIKTLSHVCHVENHASKALAKSFGGTLVGSRKEDQIYRIDV